MTAVAKSSPEAEVPYVLSEVRDGIGIVTLNRPEKRNPLSSAMMTALQGQVEAFEADPDVRVVILRSQGPVFSAGHDLHEVLSMNQQQASDLLDQCTAMMEKIRLTPKPVIAQVHALATAAGCQLASTCDLIVASETAAFQFPGVMIGLFCSTPMIPASKVLPPKKALEMLLTGTPMPAKEAALHGLVNRVVPPAELEAATLALADEIKAFSRFTVGLGKEAFYKSLPLGMKESYAVGQEALLRNLANEDASEGMNAFLEKRTPQWKY